MALVKSMETSWAGVASSYHYIPQESIAIRDGWLMAKVFSYTDAESRLRGEPPIAVGDLRVEFDASKPTMQQLYEALKSTSGFAGSEDEMRSIGAELRARQAAEAFDARARELAKSHAASQEREVLAALPDTPPN